MRAVPVPVRRRAGIRRPTQDKPAVPENPTPEHSTPEHSTPRDSTPEDPTSESTVEEQAEVEDPPPPRKGLLLPLTLLLLAALLTASGIWALTTASTANRAVVDTAATAEVSQQVRDTLERVFSYRHDDTAATESAARELLTGPAATQYETLFAQVRDRAPAQKLTLASKVVSSGVKEITADRAVLLVFLDQTATRADTGQTSAAGAQLTVTAVWQDGHWLIADLTPR